MAVILKRQSSLSQPKFVRKIKARIQGKKLAKANDADLLKAAKDDATIDTTTSLPRTLSEALPEDPVARANDPRAIVVTEATGTFNMIGCNKAWENLCGYAECKIQGKDSSILQGPDSNYKGLSDAVARLFEGEEDVKVVTTNYRKDGSRFKNLLTLGPIKDSEGKLTHFVASLRNIGNIDPK